VPWTIVESELIQYLKDYDGPRFHAVLSDPPYALISITKRFGKEGSAPAQKGEDGRYSRLSSGFMGQSWDGFDSLEHYQDWIAEWSKLLIARALYPGAVALFFGGTRTYHHLGVGLERGGFEIVDCLMWLHGQGFPKSHDISKGLDKRGGKAQRSTEFKTMLSAAVKKSGKTRKEINEACGFTMRYDIQPEDDPIGWGITYPSTEIWEVIKRILPVEPGWDEFIRGVEREVVATEQRQNAPSGIVSAGREGTMIERKITVPHTDQAKLWNGYGTALKPAWEPIFLCRAPRGDKTFAQLAVEFGTGTLNIDGSRIAHSEPIKPMGAQEGGNKVYGQAGRYEPTTELKASGRWPANFVLSHHEECVRIGEFEVEGRKLNRYPSHGAGGSFAFYAEDHRGEGYESEQMPPETVERWACVNECPVRALDDQVGILKSGHAEILHRSSSKHSRVYSPWTETQDEEGATYGDAGGPSRFFYTAKASRAEKDKGLESFWWKRTDKGFERIGLDEYEQLDRRERAHGCIHPTVKPLELLRYLATLVLPPKQEGNTRRMFIPFSGSGSEMIGSVQAGWDETVGLEMESIYNEMAEARLAANIGMF
jgi:hypothetical protein